MAAIRNGSRGAVFRFALLFAISHAVVLTAGPFLDDWCRWTARGAGWILAAAEIRPLVTGSVLNHGGFAVKVIPECTPWFALSLFSAFVLAFPAAPGRRLRGLLWGLPLIVIADLARIALLLYAGARHPGFFREIHVFSSEFLMPGLIVALSWRWLRASGSTAGEITGRLPRLLLFAPLFFLLWLPGQHFYIRGIDRIMRWGFALADWQLAIPYDQAFYPQTFGLPLFWSLVAATPGLPPRRKVKALAGGTLAFGVVHLLFRVGNVLLTGFGAAPVFHLTRAIHIISQLLLPLLLWSLAAGRATDSRSRGKCHAPIPA